MDDSYFFTATPHGHDPDLLEAPVGSKSGIFASETVWAPGNATQLGGAEGWNRSTPPGDGDSNHPLAKAARKRALDRMYRLRQKKVKEEMKSQLEVLTKENSQLTDENKRLKLEAETMKSSLQAQATQIENLKNALNRFRLEYDKQNALKQLLSEICAKSPHLQLENQRLRLENDLHKAVQQPQPTFDELVQLKLENRVLRVQNDALCGKILQECDVHQQLEEVDPPLVPFNELQRNRLMYMHKVRAMCPFLVLGNTVSYANPNSTYGSLYAFTYETDAT